VVLNPEALASFQDVANPTVCAIPCNISKTLMITFMSASA
jgi:hypothetical protein